MSARAVQSEHLASLRLQLSEGAAPDTLCVALSDEVDAMLLQRLHADLDPQLVARLAVLAVGGYGRQEMYPHADIDIVVLYDDAGLDPGLDPEARLDSVWPGAAEALKRWLVARVDDGRRVSARVRGLQEHARQITADMTIAAASLDGRWVQSIPGAPDDPLAWTLQVLEAHGSRANLAHLIHQGVQHRHQQFGGSAFLLEPQLKSGRGGLRDEHAVRWVAALRFGATDHGALIAAGALTTAEARDLAETAGFVRRVRLCLHALSRWKNDRLAFERQAEVARLMGFGHGDASTNVASFMKEFYRRADMLANLCERLVERWNAHDDDHDAQQLDARVVRRGQLLDLVGPDAARTASPTIDADEVLADVEALLAHAEETGLRLHPRARGLLRDQAAQLPADAALLDRAQAVLRAALTTRWPDAPPVRVLMDLGMFRVLLPEWAHLEGNTSHDVYHVYTTDRHLLEAFRRIVSLDHGDDVLREEGARQVPAFVRAAWDALCQADPSWRLTLRVATLLHDVGKGMQGDHSIIGAGMAAEAARRLGLPIADQDRIRRLVLDHLLLPRVSQRRDLSDPETARTVARRVPGAADLDALMILTWADMTSVAPGFTSAWKLELLRDLHERVHAELRGAGPTRVPLDQRVPVRKALDAGRLTPASLEVMRAELEGISDALHDGELGAALRLVPRVRDQEQPVAIDLDGPDEANNLLLSVCTTDRPALLADLAAAVAAARLNILQARIFTTASGLVLDHFTLEGSVAGGRSVPPRRLDALQNRVRDVVVGSVRGEDLLEEGSGESRIAPPHRPPVPTEIRIVRPSSDPTLYAIEIRARDRLGLLADLARAMARAGLGIERSLVSAEGDRAIDTFYIRAPDGLDADSLRQRLLDAVELRGAST